MDHVFVQDPEVYSDLPTLFVAMINMVDLYLEGPRREKLESAINSQNDLTGFAREAMRMYTLLSPIMNYR